MKNLIDCIKYQSTSEYSFDTFEDFCKKSDDANEELYLDSFCNNPSCSSFCTYQEYLFETLTRSYDLGKLFDTLISMYRNATFSLKDAYENKGFINSLLGRQKRYHLHIKVKYNKQKCNILDDERFKSLMNLYNCFVTRKIETDTICEFYIEQVYNSDVTLQTYKENRYLYHITSKEKWNKIKKYGLAAKEGQREYFNHPARIYVLREDTDIEEIKLFAKKLYPENNYIILKIDLKKLKTPKNEKLRFYTDPAYGSSIKGLYTLGPILPSCIEEIEL